VIDGKYLILARLCITSGYHQTFSMLAARAFRLHGGHYSSASPARAARLVRCFSPAAAKRCDRCVPAQPGKSPPPKATSSPAVPPIDHREIGRSLDLFSVTKYSPGSPLFHPNGSHVFLKLQEFLRAQYDAFGFEEVVSPTIYKKSLWEVSGHWENYRDDMFEVNGRGASGRTEDGQIGEDEQYGLKPMNCPGHCLIYKSQRRSYRDLPIRYADFSPLHRNEVSGSLSGLTRVRRFHQDDGHIFCTLDQVREEITDQLRMVQSVYKAFGFHEFKLVLSSRPEAHYIGEVKEWDRAEEQLKEALDATGHAWELNAGDGAFYGPKIDIILKDSNGKEHQTATIQLDFQLPQRFDLTYQGQAPESVDATSHGTQMRPVIIHRAVLGSLERFMALLLEHNKGHLPFWLSPRQLQIITTNTDAETTAYAEHVATTLNGRGDAQTGSLVPLSKRKRHFRVQVDSSAEKVGRKIRACKRDRWSLTAIVGPEEVRNGNLSVDLSAFTEEIRGCTDKSMPQQLQDALDQDTDMRQVRMDKASMKDIMCWLEDRFY
jgi:threonyl-tRNA synthetase